MSNVPDDWNAYWRRCDICGRKWHASEGGCDCTEALEDCPCGKREWATAAGSIYCLACNGRPDEEQPDEDEEDDDDEG